ncbi:hypothetical protein LIER_17473 [Lithospermum erythrorhizon]|uniref:Uncharacterized protein n=1 Tax=Lithospermum erythrorhizon TaxID=34254 RepID=A0AAV3QAH6_LITER
MSETRQPFPSAQLHSQPNYILSVGSRYSGRPPKNCQIQEIFHCGSRVLHQMGRSEDTPQAGSGAGVSVPEENLHEVWGTRVLVANNGTQFTAGKIEDICTELDVDHMTTSVSYPQENG